MIICLQFSLFFLFLYCWLILNFLFNKMHLQNIFCLLWIGKLKTFEWMLQTRAIYSVLFFNFLIWFTDNILLISIGLCSWLYAIENGVSKAFEHKRKKKWNNKITNKQMKRTNVKKIKMNNFILFIKKKYKIKKNTLFQFDFQAKTRRMYNTIQRHSVKDWIEENIGKYSICILFFSLLFAFRFDCMRFVLRWLLYM